MQEVAPRVENEKKLVKTRYTALKLVLGKCGAKSSAPNQAPQGSTEIGTLAEDAENKNPKDAAKTNEPGKDVAALPSPEMTKQAEADAAPGEDGDKKKEAVPAEEKMRLMERNPVLTLPEAQKRLQKHSQRLPLQLVVHPKQANW